MPESDTHRLVAEVTDGETLSITVESNGTTYEDTEVDIGLLIQNQKFVSSFERPILSLLTLSQRTQASEGSTGEFEEDELEDLPSADA